jgi:hypothetical protein
VSGCRQPRQQHDLESLDPTMLIEARFWTERLDAVTDFAETSAGE